MKYKVNGSLVPATDRLRQIAELAMMVQTTALEALNVDGAWGLDGWTGFDYVTNEPVRVEVVS